MQKKSRIETVLILQGGGSLGAYECGVFKTLAKNGIRFAFLYVSRSHNSLGLFESPSFAKSTYSFRVFFSGVMS